MDTSKIGTLAANAMERVAEAHEDEDEAVIRSAAMVIEVDFPHASRFIVAATDDRTWVQIAMLDEGIRMIENALKARAEDD